MLRCVCLQGWSFGIGTIGLFPGEDSLPLSAFRSCRSWGWTLFHCVDGALVYLFIHWVDIPSNVAGTWGCKYLLILCFRIFSEVSWLGYMVTFDLIDRKVSLFSTFKFTWLVSAARVHQSRRPWKCVGPLQSTAVELGKGCRVSLFPQQTFRKPLLCAGLSFWSHHKFKDWKFPVSLGLFWSSLSPLPLATAATVSMSTTWAYLSPRYTRCEFWRENLTKQDWLGQGQEGMST